MARDCIQNRIGAIIVQLTVIKKKQYTANFPTQIVTIVFKIDLWEYFPNKTVTYYRSDSQPYFETFI